MCNRYHVPGDEYKPQFVGDPPFGTSRRIGPYQTGKFFRPSGGRLEGVVGQWGMIPKRSRVRRPTFQTNCARVETVAELATYRDAWTGGRRCLVPALEYDYPNWETGKCIWWAMRRRDGQPWALAGIWSEWTDPQTGEVVPNYSMITVNCDGHPLLGRLHKPELDLPPDQQDKRTVVPLEVDRLEQWLHGTEAEARALLVPAPVDVYDLLDAERTDALLAQRPASLF